MLFGVVHVAPDSAVTKCSVLSIATQGDDGFPEVARRLCFAEALGQLLDRACSPSPPGEVSRFTVEGRTGLIIRGVHERMCVHGSTLHRLPHRQSTETSTKKAVYPALDRM